MSTQNRAAPLLRRRGALRTVSLLLPVLLIAGGESLLWLLLEHPHWTHGLLLQPLRSYYHRHDLEVAHFSSQIAQWDPELFYLLRPGSHRFENREFSTNLEVNSAGLRDNEQSLSAPSIIVLGDSYTMGWGVEQDETFVQHLERRTGFRTLNAGISSFGTARELMLLRRLDRSNLRLLVIQYCPNDLAENRRAINGSLWSRRPAEGDWTRATEAQQKKLRYWPGKHLVGVIQHWLPERATTPVANPVHGARPGAMTPAEAFLALLARSDLPPGLPLIVLSLEAERVDASFVDSLREAVARARDPRIQQLARQLTLLDLTTRLDNGNRFLLDPHLNAQGHRQVGEALANLALQVLSSTRPDDESPSAQP